MMIGVTCDKCLAVP